MPDAIIDQLLNGVRVRTASGQEITCRPLPLKEAIEIIELWEVWANPRARVLREQLAGNGISEAERAKLDTEYVQVLKAATEARMKAVRVFSRLYPELTPHISAGDVQRLLPDFFWSATGAEVRVPEMAESAPTGTPPSATTSPSGASSPT